MDIGGLIERLEHVTSVRADADAPVSAIESALTATSEVAAWLTSSQAEFTARLATRVSFPERHVAERLRCSLAAASKVAERADTLAALPAIGAALDAGAITAAHVDVVTRAAKQLPPDQRRALHGTIDALSGLAATATVEQFQRRVRDEVRGIQRGAGLDRLARQRRATRLRTWVDAEGMWRLDGRFDPVAGVRLAQHVDAELEALFAEPTPHECPDDPVEKQHFLRALAFARLVLGQRTSGGTGRPEFVVVLDPDAPSSPGARSSDLQVDWGLPVEIPHEVLATLVGNADVHTVVVRNGVVLHAPGTTDLGRTTRLANRAQRRALRAMYATCCVPGCRVVYDRCVIHHILWWRHGGRTDLDNLIPICPRHHTKVHHDGWGLELGPGRQLSLRLPDGTVRTRGPTRRAAA